MIQQIVRVFAGLTFAAVAPTGAAQGPTAPLPEAQVSTIGYPTVADALAALHSDPGVTFSTQDGWTVAQDLPHRTIWSFAPTGHAAYPSAVKRSVVVRDGKTFVDMKVLCQASKAARDDLVRQFDGMTRTSR